MSIGPFLRLLTVLLVLAVIRSLFGGDITHMLLGVIILDVAILRERIEANGPK